MLVFAFFFSENSTTTTLTIKERAKNPGWDESRGSDMLHTAFLRKSRRCAQLVEKLTEKESMISENAGSITSNLALMIDSAVAGCSSHCGETSLFERKVKVQMQLFGHNQEEVTSCEVLGCTSGALLTIP
jgi:hypothetical protein